MNDLPKRLDDADRLLLVFYLATKGLPPWAGKPSAEAWTKIARRLFDWPLARAEMALAELHLRGHINAKP